MDSFHAGQNRNYSYLYDSSLYTSLWVAYPLYAATTGGTRTESWAANPNISESEQINTWKGSYGVSYGTTLYARGHQIPDADRSANSTMQAQTYYATNLTPQIQDKFNGGVWMNLEDAVRKAIPASDTLYVATGAAFRTVGGGETITYIQPQHDTKKAPVPNYYYKVLLKVKRDSNGTVTSASTIGFWLKHEQTTQSYTEFAVSVEEIEAKTGHNFFANLPTAVATEAEKNSSWTTFQNF
ncbi:MAG: DNA/RNA non-specific endonuclease [Tidjanibacter sp.]|nr:DNA/RNA non-specific endonuclease [Tidjanibacter sp.]